jgi:histidine ammonia-lyase
VAAARRVLRGVLRPLREDRVLATDIAAVAALVEDGSLVAAVEKAVGALD